MAPEEIFLPLIEIIDKEDDGPRLSMTKAQSNKTEGCLRDMKCSY